MLYTISTSPFQCDFTSILRIIKPKSTILLIQDGVIAAIRHSTHLNEFHKKNADVYALSVDINARGLQNMISELIILASYHDFVRLTADHQQHFSL